MQQCISAMILETNLIVLYGNMGENAYLNDLPGILPVPGGRPLPLPGIFTGLGAIDAKSSNNGGTGKTFLGRPGLPFTL